MCGGEIEVFVMRELLISRPREGLECDALIGLDIFDKALWGDRKRMRELSRYQ